MNALARRALKSYDKVGVETGVSTADPLKLVLMLYEGAGAALANARRYLHEGDTARRGESISKAIAIIDNGLRASLDVEAGGSNEDQFAGLSEYM